MPNIKILLVSHKPFKIPEGEYFLPIHAGRSVAMQASKDGKIDNEDFKWLMENTVGDDTGDNISEKNRYYSECSALYWAWKNYDKIGNPDYIGLMHYRRHFVFNEDYFLKKCKDDWHKALAYISENFINEKYISNIGLNDDNIERACENYDLIVSKDSRFDLINGYNIRENYAKTIPGAEIEDFDLTMKIIREKYPSYNTVLDKYLGGYNAACYQMFIMKKELFFEYCDFLFGVLFEVEKQRDFESYTINGKRTLGYLAERILSAFVWKKQEENAKILKLGVAEVEFPYNRYILNRVLEKGCPTFYKYLFLKLKSVFAKGQLKRQLKEQYQSTRRQIKSFKKLQSYIKEKT